MYNPDPHLKITVDVPPSTRLRVRIGVDDPWSFREVCDAAKGRGGGISHGERRRRGGNEEWKEEGEGIGLQWGQGLLRHPEVFYLHVP